MNRGLKISLEGIDGVGKSTQLSPLAAYLRQAGHEVYVKPCRNNFEGQGVDDELLTVLKRSRRELARTPAAEVLIAAARSLILHDTYIAGHVAAGGIVLCDRDIDSAVAYSLPGLQRRYPEKTPQQLVQWMRGAYALEPVAPDVTFWLDAPLDVALGRAMNDEIPNERAIFDAEGTDFIREVQAVYERLSGLFPERIQRIDVAEKTIPQVTEDIVGRLGRTIADCYGGQS